MVKRILYIRSGPYQVEPNAYNLQELGLAKAFAEKGIQCDVLYYHKNKNFEQKINKGGYEINVLWRKGIKLLRSGIYPQVLNKDFLSQYDMVIVSEYSQIMAVILCKLHPNVYIYNGPYYNLFKIPFVEKLYDALFVKGLDRKIKCIFCKTEMAKDYLESKGFTKCVVTGVGLDTEKFDAENQIEPETQELLRKMQGHKNIVYVGTISKRKNVKVIARAFGLIKEKGDSETQFVVIGKDENGCWRECKEQFGDKARNSVIRVPFVKNAQLKYIYLNADIFALPSIKEIFGMVLLEAMYFGAPTVASGSAGARTLIEDGKSGYIIEDFKPESWALKMNKMLENEQLRGEMGKAASERIQKQFMWDCIAEKMMEEMV
ncbi:MAG: glycosyltransferase family 4 protein [Lachnospiraceae bacterium]|nr:glycosyltransferase family 4 protein [Lachnospiraceae bacterium]